MPGTASDLFFWNDWRGDPLLRMVSIAARGLWFEMLCIAADSPRKGYVLLNGKIPSPDELAKAVSVPVDDCVNLLAELSTWGVFSTTRQGAIYSRRMVKDTKRRAASSKGGKIGGVVSRDNKRGIFSTQGGTPVVTPGGTPHPRRAPIPLPKEVSKKNLSNGKLVGEVGWEKTRGSEGRVTIKNPDERINRFIVSLSRELDDPGMVIIGAACDLENENHDAALTLCKNAAHKLGKGWPRNWPTDHSIFERLTAKGDRTP